MGFPNLPYYQDWVSPIIYAIRSGFAQSCIFNLSPPNKAQPLVSVALTSQAWPCLRFLWLEAWCYAGRFFFCHYFLLHWANYISISFHIEWDVIVVTVFLSIMNQMDFHLVQNRKENCHHDHIPFNVKGNRNIVFRVYLMTDIASCRAGSSLSAAFREASVSRP